MFSRKILFTLCALPLLTTSMCNDSSPTGPEKSVSPSDLIGTWMNVNRIESRNDVSEIDTLKDTSTITVIDDRKMKMYFLDNGNNCYYVETVPYSISDNKVYGDYFNGGETYIRQTTVFLDGNQIKLTTTDSKGEDWWKTIVIMKRYSGPLPPPSWPPECLDKKKM